MTGIYFDSAKVNVVNRAIGGRSSRTFVTEGRWDQVLEALRPGDFVIIQFGHNDGGAINDTSRARGSIRGIGEESQEIDNLMTKKHEVIHTFGWYMRKFIAESRARLRRKVGASGRTPRSSGSIQKWRAVSFAPARCRSVERGTPVQVAELTAPRPHCTPPVFGRR